MFLAQGQTAPHESTPKLQLTCASMACMMASSGAILAPPVWAAGDREGGRDACWLLSAPMASPLGCGSDLLRAAEQASQFDGCQASLSNKKLRSLVQQMLH